MSVLEINNYELFNTKLNENSMTVVVFLLDFVNHAKKYTHLSKNNQKKTLILLL